MQIEETRACWEYEAEHDFIVSAVNNISDDVIMAMSTIPVQQRTTTMECTLKELIAKLSDLLETHPNATVCSYDDKLLVEDSAPTYAGGSEAVFEITSDAHDFFAENDCLTITAR